MKHRNSVRRGKVRLSFLILCQLSAFGVSILLASYCTLFASCHGHLLYPLSVWLTVLFAWSLLSWYLACGRLFDPYVLFMMAVMLFNGGQAFLETFRLNVNGILAGQFSSATTASTLCIVTLALASMHLGALLGNATSRKKAVCSQQSKGDTAPSSSVRVIGIAMLVASFIPFIVDLKNKLSIVASSGYFGLYQQATLVSFDSIPSIMAAFFIPGMTFLLAGSKNSRSGQRLALATVLVYVVLAMFMGLRSAGGYTLVSIAWLWDRCIHPLPRTMLTVMGGVVVFALFPSIALIRTVAGIERMTVGYVLQAFLSINNPAVAIMSEMGGSMATVAHTLELVPRIRPFDMGASYLYALLTLVPNAFWSIHPSVGRGKGSHWLVWTVDPATAAVGGGLGFSVIAEAYLNGGWAGVAAVMWIVGFVVGRLVRRTYSTSDPAMAAAVACCLPRLLGLARAESADVVRAIVWHGVLPYLAVSVLRTFGMKPSGSQD